MTAVEREGLASSQATLLLMRIVLAALALTLVMACGSEDVTGSFENALEAGASCSELFDIRNELDPEDPKVPDMNTELRRTGCYSSPSERTDLGATQTPPGGCGQLSPGSSDRGECLGLEQGYLPGSEGSAFSVSYQVCYGTSTEQFRKEGFGNSDDPHTVASAYAAELYDEATAPMAEQGCLAGFEDFGRVVGRHVMTSDIAVQRSACDTGRAPKRNGAAPSCQWPPDPPRAA